MDAPIIMVTGNISTLLFLLSTVRVVGCSGQAEHNSPPINGVFLCILFCAGVSTSICNRVFLHVITWDFCDSDDTFTQHHADKNHRSALSLGHLAAARPIYLTFVNRDQQQVIYLCRWWTISWACFLSTLSVIVRDIHCSVDNKFRLYVPSSKSKNVEI